MLRTVKLQSLLNLSCKQCRSWRASACFKRQSTDAPTSLEADESEFTSANVSPSLEQHRDLPLMVNRQLEFPPKYSKPLQAWLETLSDPDDKKLGIVDLHPEVFGIIPKIDVLYENVKWQSKYRKIDYRKAYTRAEMRGGGRKPWPQKGTGRARHGSIRSPLWKGGGACFGPRGPTSFYYLLDTGVRVLGLQSALSAKYAQDYLHVVDSLELPTDDPTFLENLVESRGWGMSVLFIDDTDYISKNFAIASSSYNDYNVMPVYGLNVYSMLKHETLVLTLPALEKIEHKLLTKLNAVRPMNLKANIKEYL